ncbi:MAG TPA: TldD/PmbA family protein [Usitatibacteraceae bacterium]|nr:TldD/PmbA family protein [Usitatibacteraceae bacterium]
MLDALGRDFRAIAPAVDFCALRFVEESSELLTVRQDVAEPPQLSTDRGAMVTVIDKGGLGYAATSDLTPAGLREAASRATRLAQLTAGRSVVDYGRIAMPSPRGTYASPPGDDPARLTRREKLDLLAGEAKQCRIDERIVDWEASLWTTRTRQAYFTADGGEVEQVFHYLVPNMSATAHANGITQTRSHAGRGNGYCRQGGLEILDSFGLKGSGRSVAEGALELLAAPNCPGGKMDVLLMPDQMMLQIHESIGHPLELDRILGDERNFAGTSFVTLDMFGSYRYGSELLDVTFDPARPEEFASYGWDDDGLAAERQFLIRKGILERPLGGAISQARAGIAGVANTRACSWNRAPIDRMANLNIEPGRSSLDDLIAGIDQGVMMRTNISWSIDDSRNKFQFGCEWGRMIRNGRLAEVVKNPNYRGISATFWRSLSGVGDASTFEVMGTPFCGKGEPNQVIRCGHASPACRFSGVDVFGGAA